MHNIHCIQYIVHIHCIHTCTCDTRSLWRRQNRDLPGLDLRSRCKIYNMAIQRDIQYDNMAIYGEIWQDMAMQYGKATALISRMEASHEITKLTDRALAVLDPRRIILQNCRSFFTNNQFYFSNIFAWQKYSM